MDKVKGNIILRWRLQRTLCASKCTGCSRPSGLKLLCPKCGNSEYCSILCMIEDGAKHFTLCLGITDCVPLEVEYNDISELPRLIHGRRSEKPLQYVNWLLPCGQCVMCSKPPVGIQLLCSKCGKSECCSISCMIENGRSHFDFCNIRACPVKISRRVSRQIMRPVNPLIYSMDNVAAAPPRRTVKCVALPSLPRFCKSGKSPSNVLRPIPVRPPLMPAIIQPPVGAKQLLLSSAQA